MSLDAILAAKVDQLIAERGYRSVPGPCATCCTRICNGCGSSAGEASRCMASLSCAYNHHQRDLAWGRARGHGHRSVGGGHVYLNPGT